MPCREVLVRWEVRGGKKCGYRGRLVGVKRFEESFLLHRGFSNKIDGFSTGFPQGVEKVWGTDGKNEKKMLRPREMLKKHGGNEWKSERNGVVENSVENVENFSERSEKLSFPQVRRKKFSDVENG